MSEGDGDVAFVSHLTVFQSTGKDNDLNPGNDFQLLCPDGTRAGVVNYILTLFRTILREGAAFIQKANARNLSLNSLFAIEILTLVSRHFIK